MSAERDLLARIMGELGSDAPSGVTVPSDSGPPHPVPLPARTDVSALAWASVAAVSATAAQLVGAAAEGLDPDRIAVAYSSERFLTLDGEAPGVWAPLSGFFRTSDGWVRTHGNYPHHAAALRRALGLPGEAGQDEVGAALRGMPAGVATQAVSKAGGLCVPVAHENPVADAALRQVPLVGLHRIGDGRPPTRSWGPPDAPLSGIRVLDLTRVIAGPVATRTLALLGADVLRIDPPRLPEPVWQHLDTGHGKRSALLDVSTPDGRGRLEALLSDADVLVTGYRPAAMAVLGLDPAALIGRHPALVVARLSAWGFDDSSAGRRGFDSLVQAASGIAWIESPDGERPGALPAQALDHSAGYLLAAGVMAALARRATGGGWLVETSLRRVAAELLGMARTRDPRAMTVVDPSAHVQAFEVGGVRLTTAGPAIAYAGGPGAFAPPRPWGSDQPAWA